MRNDERKKRGEEAERQLEVARRKRRTENESWCYIL